MCRTIALAATILALTATYASADEAPRKAGAAERTSAARLDPLGRAAFWAREAELDSRDAEAGVALSQALRALGRNDEAAAAAGKVLINTPDDIGALLEQARSQIASGQGFFAIEPAERAARLAPQDWRPAALLAVALEQAERDDEARVAHQRALTLAPAEPTVLSNAALYHAGHGELSQAESMLRKAAAMPSASAQVRLNLVLVVGLQGRFDEAEALARKELPPETVRANMAWLKSRTSATAATTRSWDAMRGS
ncbi:pilus assembly protein TadD [Caulobacter sp. NIBR2454]|uniref:pilus assembly protein TadD n=1 Tax=Caulobacter sp. NIBR2454 TaxID=3015996 RepID=UPI0022B74F97|nr:pilus assembly protein TadD [Caulobacter sp. NIBR2454]